MAIGSQRLGRQNVAAAELRSRYDHLIKEALLKARPNLEVIRADDVALPGSITTDIITRLMNSDYVVADITFPNPNVFYELGLRHACKVGTLLIKDRSAPRVPFDVSHLRHIEYVYSPGGLKALSTTFADFFAHFERDPERPDNQFQELAKLTGFIFPEYRIQQRFEERAITATFEDPDLLKLFLRSEMGDPPSDEEVTKAFLSNPKLMKALAGQEQAKSRARALKRKARKDAA